MKWHLFLERIFFLFYLKIRNMDVVKYVKMNLIIGFPFHQSLPSN
jgi:hypothetical protein